MEDQELKEKEKEKEKEKKKYKQEDVGQAIGDQSTSDNVPKSESTASVGPSNPY